jgi:hypothetical protein
MAVQHKAIKRLQAECDALLLKYDALHDQRHEEARKADALAERVKTLDAALLRFFNEGQGLGGSHPHLAAYVAHDKSVWEQGRAALAGKP